MKTILVLPDGRQISSGVAGKTAVQSCALTQCVNIGTELEAGAVCATMAEIRLWLEEELTLQAGQEITILKDQQPVGIFLLEKPTRPTANTMALTAYDRIVKLDRDVSGWLGEYKRWPCSARDLARDVCQQCGVELVEGQFPNGDYQVPKFSAEGITGRALLQYIAQIAGRFVQATADGRVEFAWYTPSSVAIAPDSRQSQYISAVNGNVTVVLPGGTFESDGQGNLTVDCPILTAEKTEENVTLTADGDLPAVFYYQGGLNFENYETQKISRVVLRHSQEDAGVGYPQEAGNENDYVITANPLLTGQKDALLEVARNLYEQLQDVRYTPCRISLEATDRIRPGHKVQVQDKNGRFFTAYIMSRKRTGGKDLLECTGSYRRGSTTQLNNETLRNLQGRVLNLRKDVDGILVTHKDAQENLAQLQLSLNGLQATVQQQEKAAKAVTTLEQSAQNLQMRIQSIENNGAGQIKTETGYTFDRNGLHIQKSGQEMGNTLDHTGMYVRRGEQMLLQANHEGVEAADVTVHNYLVVGKHARFEDYDGGTGCFWI